MKENSDAEILELINSTRTFEKGFRALVDKYQQRLYWHIRRMVVHHEDADDVIQNTFIKVFKGLKGFNGDSKLYTWLYRIATNESLNHLQQRKRSMTQSIESEGVTLAERLKADIFFDGDEIQAKLILAVQTLPEKQRAVFTMRYHDDLPYADISAILGTSVGGLKASYHHAVKKVEHYLKEEEV